MPIKFAFLSAAALAGVLSLTACNKTQTADTAPPIEPGTAAVAEMKPTGDLAPAFGSSAPGTPATATGSAVPEMTPTGNLKQAVIPSKPTEPAPPAPPTPKGAADTRK